MSEETYKISKGGEYCLRCGQDALPPFFGDSLIRMCNCCGAENRRKLLPPEPSTESITKSRFVARLVSDDPRWKDVQFFGDKIETCEKWAEMAVHDNSNEYCNIYEIKEVHVKMIKAKVVK